MTLRLVQRKPETPSFSSLPARQRSNSNMSGQA
jgi:hypothetical protein